MAVSAIAFLSKELAPTHRRFVEAARTALKTTVTTGCAATLQILGPFGALFAFRLGQPGISFGLFEGSLTIISAAIMQAAIVPITGKLLDYPGLIIAFLFVVFAALGYLLSNTRLFLILALVAVGTITTVYVGIFEPGQIGWGSTYTFDGILAATLVMVAVDVDLAVAGGTKAAGVRRRRLRTIANATRNGRATPSRSALRAVADSTTCIAPGPTSGAAGGD